MAITDENTYLRGIRVLELADELGEYAGKLLAGLGADVVKVEPPQGEETRNYGPFYKDQPDPNRSLYFWHYNHGKRGIVLDLDTEAGRQQFASLAAVADVVLDARPKDYLDSRGLGYEELRKANPGLIYARVTPFGETGPWADFVGSDLVHLALGGMMSNSGYEPDPFLHYDTPPIAPQMWQAYHVAGEYLVIALLGALSSRLRSGAGQRLSVTVHKANASNTEGDLPTWVSIRAPYLRQTGRHASTVLTTRGIAPTKDGRYLFPFATYMKNFPDSWAVDRATLEKYGMLADLDGPEWDDSGYRAEHSGHIADVMDKLINRLRYDSGLWQEMVAAGLTWAPVRKPEENLDDEHWRMRDIFTEVEHPELGESFRYIGARWVSRQVGWKLDRRAPLLGEHNEEVPKEWGSSRVVHAAVADRPGADFTPVVSQRGRPFPLAGVRVVDLSWMVASAGSTRFLSAMGAEVIKVEHISRLDGMRYAMPYPEGGRAARDAATAPLTPAPVGSPNQSSAFNEINSGKLALSLKLSDPRGKKILEDLIRDADVVMEGFSPGTMDRMGLGYDRLKELNPRIVYVQQSGMGQLGTYGGARAFGPTAQAFSGLTEMSGFPVPWPPAGIGYSYLDWFGAYNMATAILAALYRRSVTGEGCWIDASQVETGIYLEGSAILDYTVNGRGWSRTGNRSPWKPAAPHGAYKAEGEDHWIAIASFTEEQWQAVVDVLGSPSWAADPRFATLDARLENQDALDALVESETSKHDRYELMYALQARGVPAGVTQTAADRIDDDPQLAELGFMVELDQTEAGRWPIRDFVVEFSETPAYIGGIKDRGAPNYGEDTDDVLSRVLGLSAAEIDELRREEVV